MKKTLYNRQNDKLIELNPIFDKDKEKSFLHFVLRGTRPNQLFLTNSISQNIDSFRPVYNWFKDNLRLISPNSTFMSTELFFNENFSQYMDELLPNFDTNISRLGGKEIELPKEFKRHFQKELNELNENDDMHIFDTSSSDRLTISKGKNGDLITKKLVSFHSKADGTEVEFNLGQESAGSQRMIDLLPEFIEMSRENCKKVYVIDEVDRSLHPMLTRALIEFYLESCHHQSRAQLITTTHDILLMDSDLFRRDEIWIAERDHAGSSQLISLSDYKKDRRDKDIRKSYLQGRFGGIPKLRI